MTMMEPEDAARRILAGLERRRNMLNGTAPRREIEISWTESTTHEKATPMSAALSKRVATLEAQVPGSEHTPFVTFKSPWLSPEGEAEFEAKLDAQRRAHPRQQIIIATWRTDDES
jgi:hypothetical protein